MNLLNHLKAKAQMLQDQQVSQQAQQLTQVEKTHRAAYIVWEYFSELARQLNVLVPAAAQFALDVKNQWPDMKLIDFAADIRHKRLFESDVVDYVNLSWRIVPQQPDQKEASIRVNFPPDMERVQSRLSIGGVRHQRLDFRDPVKNTLQVVQFDYELEARGNVRVTVLYEKAALGFRMVNMHGFEQLALEYPVDQINLGLLDNLFKRWIDPDGHFISLSQTPTA